MAEILKFNPKTALTGLLDKALNAQFPIAANHLARLRRVHPDKTPAELLRMINRNYLTVVTASGAGAGAAAIAPNGWIQAPVAVADLATFLEASVLYSLVLAEIHGVHVEDFERRKTLVLAVLVGDSAANAVLRPIIEKSVPYWGKLVVKAIPMPAINAANKVLGGRFIAKWGTVQGTLILGKQVPAFIGVGIGAGGNHVFGRFVISATKKILGPVPEGWDDTVGNATVGDQTSAD